MAQKQSFLRSVKTAIHGLVYAFSNHRNLKIMMICSVFTILVSVFLHINLQEWTIISLCIIVVIGLELINTAIEEILDLLHPEYHEKVGIAKDIAADAVLFAGIGAAIAGLCIFVPKLFHIF